MTSIVAAYYLHPDVQRVSATRGRSGVEVVADPYPEYVHDGLLERVLRTRADLPADAARAGRLGVGGRTPHTCLPACAPSPPPDSQRR